VSEPDDTVGVTTAATTATTVPSAADAGPDDGDGDGGDDGGPDDGPEGPESAAGGAAGDAPRRKRRRRRRRRGGEDGAPAGEPGKTGGAEQATGNRAETGDRPQATGSGQLQSVDARPAGERAPSGENRDRNRDGGGDRNRQPQADDRNRNRQPQAGDRNRQPQADDRNRNRQPQADDRNRNRQPQAGDRNRQPQAGDRNRQPQADGRDRNRGGGSDRDRNRGGERDRLRGGDREQSTGREPVAELDDALGEENAAERFGARREDALPSPEPRRASQPVVDEDEAPVAKEAWGTDDEPAQPIQLAADLPVDPVDDPDPLTAEMTTGAQLGDDIVNVVAVRFVPAGRLSWFDAGDGDYAPGERVMVDSDRGARLATIATVPQRKATRDRGLRRVVRRANEGDLRGERSGDEERTRALRVAKDAAEALRLPLKVFRVELFGALRGGKLNVYYTSDDRLDLRDFVREVANATGARLELRQLGVRDEAKMVGGIGSCGLTLCCTTWLPDFVPVSIKMAKDQGLVLSPTKVSGQCGRLKCCLVYEQAGYAEMRKGLPKLGKRVISQRGEGRVVEVDVLRQRVRVSYGPGDAEVLPASEVKPMFPSQQQQQNAAQLDDDDEPAGPDA
jgi:cell fate regulator YaaT (PSP1 superfamily)